MLGSVDAKTLLLPLSFERLYDLNKKVNDLEASMLYMVLVFSSKEYVAHIKLGALADQFYCSIDKISRLLNVLEKKGLISKKRLPHGLEITCNHKEYYVVDLIALDFLLRLGGDLRSSLLLIFCSSLITQTKVVYRGKFWWFFKLSRIACQLGIGLSSAYRKVKRFIKRGVLLAQSKIWGTLGLTIRRDSYQRTLKRHNSSILDKIDNHLSIDQMNYLRSSMRDLQTLGVKISAPAEVLHQWKTYILSKKGYTFFKAANICIKLTRENRWTTPYALRSKKK